MEKEGKSCRGGDKWGLVEESGFGQMMKGVEAAAGPDLIYQETHTLG